MMILCANPRAQFLSYQEEIEQAITRVVRGNRYILGPEVEALESEFAEYIGTSKAVGVANGTDAIEIALRALGIGVGDEVITVSHTAVATVAAIEAAGAVPVLVDVDPNYYTIDPSQLGDVITSRTRAVIAVHLYGQAADLDAIGQFCTDHGLALIEDVSQAHGARWRGRRLGSIGRVGCFSCYPTKNLGAIGDAGLITTNDEVLAERIKMLREYGWRNRYISERQGRNSRLDEIQATILRIKLRNLDADNDRRRERASQYNRLLVDFDLILPKTRFEAEHVFHLYVVRTRRRQELMSGLIEANIQPGIHYPMPIHCQGAYNKRIRTAATMHVTDTLANEVMSLPMYPELSTEQVEKVVSALELLK
jgi:dTDP-4-amino-4,6-dideoxygalactose transaminase